MITTTIKVLAVDNEQLLLWALERAGKGRLLDIKTASTTEQALVEVGQCHYDLFLLDFDLQEPSHRELLQAIDECCPYVPIILMTTSDTESLELNNTIRATRKRGAWHLLEKPFSLDKLTSFIEVIFRDEGTVKGGINSLTHNYDREKRRHLRRPYVQSVNFSFETIVGGVLKRVPSKGILTDISDGGSCLLAHEQLQPDQVITFEDNSLRQCGGVSWSRVIEEETYRYGLQFC